MAESGRVVVVREMAVVFGGMTMRVATVSIVHPSSTIAGKEVAEGLILELGAAPRCILLFVSSRHDPRSVMDGLGRRLPDDTIVVGCSSFGEINAEEALTGSVTAMGFTDIDCAAYKVDHMLPDGRAAGRELAKRAKAFEPNILITFADGIMGSPADLVRGMQDVLGTKFPIVGGVAAEHLAFERTYEIHGREVLSGGAVALALRGNMTIATAAKSGFQPVGNVRTVTRVEGKNLILELDGVPALRIYKEFLGQTVRDQQMVGIEFPLLCVPSLDGDYMDSDDRTNVVRVVRKLDEERGGLLLSSEIAVGSKVRLTCSTKDDLLEAAGMAVNEALEKVPKPDVALIFGCACRKLILGSRYQEEIRRAFRSLDAAIPKVGFYTYGELSPVRDTTVCHDATFTVVLLGS
ncbi:MAG: FIST C-terminal domain-containing protein [Polyangiaceae bacterium]|nr:FIST C-terminal domain-containing protein [Polyangiaceae bacterium]